MCVRCTTIHCKTRKERLGLTPGRRIDPSRSGTMRFVGGYVKGWCTGRGTRNPLHWGLQLLPCSFLFLASCFFPLHITTYSRFLNRVHIDMPAIVQSAALLAFVVASGLIGAYAAPATYDLALRQSSTTGSSCAGLDPTIGGITVDCRLSLIKPLQSFVT